MLRKVIFVALIVVMVSAVFATAALAGGQEKVTVCHKPGTDAEKTLEISAKALPAHLAHGDTEGECGGAPPSTGCEALNALDPDLQTDPATYNFGLAGAEFFPGEIIHIDMTITTDPANGGIIYQSVGVGSPMGSVASDGGDIDPGQTNTVSLDYTVIVGDGVSVANAFAGQGGVGDTFTLDDVNFWCTPN